MNNYLLLTVDNLRHGWCDVHLAQNGLEFADTISSTPNDGLGDFLRSLSFILASPRNALSQCQWSNEPGYFDLTLKSDDSNLKVIIVFIPSYLKSEMGRQEILFGIDCDLWDFSKSAFQTFHKLLKKYGPDDYERLWKHPFPINEYKALQKLLRI